MFCHNCGRQLPEDARFCSYCGTDLGELTEFRAKAAESVPRRQEQPAGVPLFQDEQPPVKKKSKKGLVIGIIAALILAAAAIILIPMFMNGTAELTAALANSANTFDQAAEALALPKPIDSESEVLGADVKLGLESLPAWNWLEGMALEASADVALTEKRVELELSPYVSGEKLLSLFVGLEGDELSLALPDIAGDRLYSLDMSELGETLESLGLGSMGLEDMGGEVFGLAAELASQAAGSQAALESFKKELAALLPGLETVRGEMLRKTVLGQELALRPFSVTLDAETMTRLCAALDKLAADSGSSLAAELARVFRDIAENNQSLVIDLGVCENQLVLVSAAASVNGDAFTLRAEFGGASWGDELCIELKNSAGAGLLLESSGVHSGEGAFVDHSVLYSLGETTEKIFVSQLHRDKAGGFELSLALEGGATSISAAGTLTGENGGLSLSVPELSITENETLRAVLSLEAKLAPGRFDARSRIAGEKRGLNEAISDMGELVYLSDGLDSWLEEKEDLLPDFIADRLISDKSRLARALTKSYAAFGAAAERLGFEKSGEYGSAEISAKIINIPDNDILNGFGLNISACSDGEQRRLNLLLRPELKGGELAKLFIELSDNVLRVTSPELSGDRLYSLDISALGSTLSALGVMDEELTGFSPDLCELSELYKQYAEKRTLAFEEYTARFMALGEELEVLSGGSGAVTVNGSSLDCDLYAVNISRELMLELVGIIEAASTGDAQNVRELFAALADTGVPRALIIEVYSAYMRQQEDYTELLTELRAFVETMPPLSLNVAVHDGYVVRVQTLLSLEDSKLLAGLDIGGGEKYTDTLSFTLSNYEDESYRVIWNGKEADGCHEGNLSLIYAHRSYGTEELGSLSLVYDRNASGNNLSLRLVDGESYPLLDVTGRIDTGENFRLSLERISVVEGYDLLAELSFCLSLKPYSPISLPGTQTVDLTGATMSFLENELAFLEKNLSSWAISLFLKYPEIIGSLM